ncbi:MAG TPA: DUF2961 domain-containing protein [Phycisphaerae bacterium]|nr:DUF2961 domain-containing protein [Phycisphaerae bacterium]
MRRPGPTALVAVHRLGLVVLVLAVGSALAAAPPIEPGAGPVFFDPLDAIWNLDSIATPRPTVQAGYFSSYDRTGENDDGFKGTYSSLYELPSGEHVIVDLQGPGCLYTLWFTGPDGGYSLPWGKLRIYLDDEPAPRLECAGETFFSGEVIGFPRPLVAHSFISTGGNVSHVPIPFAKRLLITTERRAGFYNAYYHLYPQGTPIESWNEREDLTAAIHAWNAVGAALAASERLQRMTVRIQIPGGKRESDTFELAELQGSGVLRAIRINPARPLSAFVLNNTWLRIWWDGQEHPAVDVPLGPFFGSGQGEGCVRALPIGMTASGEYYCSIPMPFQSSCRVALQCKHFEAVGEIYCELDVSRDETHWPAEGLHFNASWRREQPAAQGRDFMILDVPAGQGVYLGHTLIVEPYGPDNKQWWEGDLRVWTDHRRHPILHGTGHEDELLGGWSSRWLQGPYSLPLHGLPVVRLFDERADSQWNGAMSGYRFFAGGIPFRDGIRVSTEHGMKNSVVTNYAAVAYYYHSPKPAMRLTDSLDLGRLDDEWAHQYVADGGQHRELTAVFEADDAFGGQPSAPHVQAGSPRHNQAGGPDHPSPTTLVGRFGQQVESFSMRIDPANGGVLLRRVYHQSAGKHAARLFVNGQFVQIADVPESFTVDRWREQDIILPAGLTAGKDRLDIRFERLAGEWNAFGYRAYSLLDSPQHDQAIK